MEEFKNINNAEETATTTTSIDEQQEVSNTSEESKTPIENPDDYPECECDFDNFGDLSDDKTEKADDKPTDACDQCCSFCEGCENKSESSDASDDENDNESTAEKCKFSKITFAIGNDLCGKPVVAFGENEEYGSFSKESIAFGNADDAKAAYDVLSAFDKTLQSLNGDSLISLILEHNIIRLLESYMMQHIYAICNNLKESEHDVKVKLMNDIERIVGDKIATSVTIHNLGNSKLDPNMPIFSSADKYMNSIEYLASDIDKIRKKFKKLKKKVKKLKRKK